MRFLCGLPPQVLMSQFVDCFDPDLQSVQVNMLPSPEFFSGRMKEGQGLMMGTLYEQFKLTVTLHRI